MHHLLHYQHPHQTGPFVITDEPKLTHHNFPMSIVYIIVLHIWSYKHIFSTSRPSHTLLGKLWSLQISFTFYQSVLVGDFVHATFEVGLHQLFTSTPSLWLRADVDARGYHCTWVSHSFGCRCPSADTLLPLQNDASEENEVTQHRLRQ